MPNRIKTSRALLATALLTLPLAVAGTAEASEFLSAQSRGGVSTAQLTLKVRGLSKRTGQLMIGLYNNEDGFEAEQDFMGRTVPVTSETQQITFDSLPVGMYAIKVFHDEDSDGELDTALGIPSEPYGFSNNASDPFSAPEWDETRFALPRGQMTTVIDLD